MNSAIFSSFLKLDLYVFYPAPPADPERHHDELSKFLLQPVAESVPNAVPAVGDTFPYAAKIGQSSDDNVWRGFSCYDMLTHAVPTASWFTGKRIFNFGASDTRSFRFLLKSARSFRSTYLLKT